MVFPISDDNSDRRSTPVVTIVLIVINVIVFAFFQRWGENDKFTNAFACVPAEILSGHDMATEDQVAEDPRSGEVVRIPGLQKTPIPVYLTLITAMFMHGSLMHILGNMWFLWIFGDNVEDDLGPLRYLAFYLLTGILASLTHVFVSGHGEAAMIPSLGASGAISGVLAGYIVQHPTRRVTVILFRFLTDVPAYVAIGIWFGFQLISGLGIFGGGEGGIAYGAHIGGFVAGLVLIKPFLIGRVTPSSSSVGPYNSWRRDDDGI